MSQPLSPFNITTANIDDVFTQLAEDRDHHGIINVKKQDLLHIASLCTASKDKIESYRELEDLRGRCEIRFAFAFEEWDIPMGNAVQLLRIPPYYLIKDLGKPFSSLLNNQI